MGKTDCKYKIRLRNGKTVGPIDVDAIIKLIKKDAIDGTEKVCRIPEGKWNSFARIPELGKLLLPPGNSTMTMIAPESNPSFQKPETPQRAVKNAERKEKNESNPFGDVPTIVDIKREVNPDTEKTRLIQTTEAYREGIQKYIEDSTKIIKVNLDVPIQPEKGAQVPIASTLGLQVKKNILSQQVIYTLGIGLMMSFYFTAKEEEKKDLVREMSPKVHHFKRVQVNAPIITSKKKINIPLSTAYLNKGLQAFAKDGPLPYIAASKVFYKSVFYNPKNLVARSLLASTYIRLSEVIPRNNRLYSVVTKLLELSPKEKKLPKPVEYLVAKSEFLQMLERPTRALALINKASKTNPHPDILAEQAALYRLRGERNRALKFITDSLKMQGTRRKPRHMLLYAQLLDEKNKKSAALEVLKSFLKKNQFHGEGLYHYARILYKTEDFTRAIKTLIVLITEPHRSDKLTLAKSFILAARIYEAKKMWGQALKFVKAAKRILPGREETEELLLRIRSNDPKRQSLYKQLLAGREHEQSKEYLEAINLYTRAREAARESPLPPYYSGRLYEELGKPQQSIALYELTTKMEKKHPDSFFRLSKLYTRRFELDKAKHLMRTIKRGMKRSSRITHMLGRIALQSKDVPNARAYFLSALNAGSRVSQLYVDMGNLEANRKEQKLAEFYYSMALRYEAFNEDALLGIALSRFYKNTPSDAIRFLKSKLSARPNSPAVMTNLALIYLRSGSKELGKKYLQKAVSSNPNYARAYKLMGDLVKEEGERQSNFQEKRRSFKFALASYGAYSKLLPNEPDGYMAAAELYFYVRDLGAAAKNYHKVLSLAPNYPKARLQLAKIARNGEDTDGALKFIEEEIKRHPNSSAAHVELGKIRITTKEYALASKAFTAATRLDPKNTDAIIHLGYVHYLQNDYRSAIALFERALEINPLKADIHWKIGLAYEKEGKKKRAIASYQNFRGLITAPRKIDRVKKRIRILRRELSL